MKSTSFSADSFVDALSTYEKNDPLHISGMVKTIEGRKDAIELSPGSECDRWIKIPTSIIKRVIHLENVTCGTHSHPYVVVVLKDPAANDPYGACLAEVVRAFRRKQAPAGSAGEHPRPDGRGLTVAKDDDDDKDEPTKICIPIPTLKCWDAFDPAEYQATHGVPPAAWIQDPRCEIIFVPVCFPLPF